VRAARTARIALLPAAEAALLCRLAAAARPGAAPSAAEVAAARAALAAENARAGEAGGARGGRARGGAPAASPAPPPAGARRFEHYAEVFECLLRSWNLLAVGLYRRELPNAGLRASAETAAALAAAAGAPAADGAAAFANNRALVSYVYTSPRPDARVAPHDLIYVVRADDADVDGAADE